MEAIMTNPVGESSGDVLRLGFDRRLMFQFRGSAVTSYAGLLAYRELDDALGLSTMAGEALADARTGKNDRHALVGMLRQTVFGRLAGYEDVNDVHRLRHDPAKRGICKQCIKEGKEAIKWTGLSCRSFDANAVRLQLLALACNLSNFLRKLATPEPIRD